MAQYFDISETMEIRIKARDGAARLAEYRLRSGRKLILPTFFPVYNPNIPLITPKELQEKFHWDNIITNAYILWRHPKWSKSVKDIHAFLGFDGVVMMDSGAYQIWMYGDIEASNEEIIEFQNKIRPDIGTFLDIILPYNVDRRRAEVGVRETIQAAKIAKDMGSEEISWLATAQGSTYTDLVEENAREIVDLDFDYYAVGTLKVATNQWLFRPQVDYIMAALAHFPRSKPVHFWGLGHPATFALFVLMGIDSFDSASYALYAKDGRYMTTYGTLKLEEIEEFPCECPVCSSYTPRELRDMEPSKKQKLLAEHNLYVILAEIRRIREAIRGEYLFEYVQERVRSHPGLLEAYRYLLEKHGEYLKENTPFPKSRGFFWGGEESALRPEVRRAKELLKNIPAKRYFRKKPFGKIPLGLKYTYPFGQSHIPFEEEPREEPKPEEVVKCVLKYQWRIDVEGDIQAEVRRGKVRKVYINQQYVGMIRPSDGFFIPSIHGARMIAEKDNTMKNKVVVSEEAVEPVSKGRSVFAKFVLMFDPDLHPNQEVIVLSPSGEVIATGKAVLSAREIKEFSHHVAVKIRHHTL